MVAMLIFSFLLAVVVLGATQFVKSLYPEFGALEWLSGNIFTIVLVCPSQSSDFQFFI